MNAIEGKLRNGATILQSKHSTRFENTYVVLAQWSESNSSNPFVTWRVDKGLNASLGHYHKDLLKAVQDYNERD